MQARARKFYAADCSLVLRSRCIARRLICTQHPASTQLYAPICTRPCPLYAPQMHLSSTTTSETRSASWLAAPTRPLQRRPPARCSLSPGTRTAPAVNERHGRLARGSEGSSTRGGGRRGNDRGFWRHQRQWMECKTRFSLKI